MFNGRVINLTSISSCPGLEELQALNRISKPGNGYELTVGEPGVVQWENRFDDTGDSKVTISFNPNSRSITISCHSDVRVTVNKWHRC